MSPYGPDGRRLGIAATETAGALADEPDWRGSSERVWLASDYAAFNRVTDFVHAAHSHQADLYLSRIGVDPPVSASRLHYADHLRDFHLSLPFSEGERHWLNDVIFGGGRTLRYEHLADAIRNRVSLDSYEAGKQREIIGNNLIDSFWAWRRDIFEFEGAGGLDTTIDALRSIGRILLANVPAVSSYVPPGLWEQGEIREARRSRREAEAARPRK
jgi:hypothetical protein